MIVKVNKMALIKAIAKTGKTTQVISDEAEICNSTIKRIIKNENSTASINTLTRIAHALNIEIEEVIQL